MANPSGQAICASVSLRRRSPGDRLCGQALTRAPLAVNGVRWQLFAWACIRRAGQAVTHRRNNRLARPRQVPALRKSANYAGTRDLSADFLP